MQMERGITVIQVAHRLDTLKASDIIYFLNYGRVVEAGGLKSLNRSAFEELLKNRVEHHNVFVFDKDESKLSGSMKKQVKSEASSRRCGTTTTRWRSSRKWTSRASRRKSKT